MNAMPYSRIATKERKKNQACIFNHVGRRNCYMWPLMRKPTISQIISKRDT